MWAPLGLENFISKVQKVECGCSWYVSNFIKLWSTYLKNEEIVLLAKKVNPLIEASDMQLITKVFSLFDGSKPAKKRLEINEDHLMLHSESSLLDVKFGFELRLEMQDPNMLFTELTFHLIMFAARSQMKQNKLIELIQKKDDEINEYKEENGFIKRSHIITKKFNLDEFAGTDLLETDSLLANIKKDSSLIFSIIDLNMFSISDDSKNKKNSSLAERSSVKPVFNGSDNVSENLISTNEIKNIIKTEVKCKKTKDKKELYLNFGTRRKREINRIKLKF